MPRPAQPPRREDVLRELFELGILDDEELELELADCVDEKQPTERAAA